MDKYRSEITTQPKNNNSDYMIDATFRNINRLFVLSFKYVENGLERYSYDQYYIPLEEIKDFNALNDNKSFFLSTCEKQTRKLIKMLRNVDYATGKLLDYLYHPNHYKRIDIDLSRQTNTIIPQQTNFVGKLDKDNGATMFLLLKSSKKLF